MRARVLYIPLLLLFGHLSLAQPAKIESNDFKRCGNTQEWYENKLATDPEYRKLKTDFDKFYATQYQKNPDCSGGPIKVPVAVHFDPGIVPSGSESCAIDLVVDQINALNLEIRGMDPQNSAFTGLESCFGPQAAVIGDACIEFCLATTNHPVGSGLTEGDFAVTFGTSSGYPIDATWDGYLNIWIENTGGGLLGQSTHIGGPFNGSGVRINACNFGSGNVSCTGWNNTSTCGGGVFNEGNTVVHEVGHYVDLLHNFNGGCGAGNDGISDTPAMDDTHNGFTGCLSHNDCADLSGLDSCPVSPGADMYMNYMAYTGDRCMYMFTSEQADVMNAWVIFQGFTTTNTKCLPPAPPVAAMNLPEGSNCEGTCLNFEDASSNIPTAWAWTFSVTSGDIVLDNTNSTDKDPTICITSGTTGIIQVDLTVTNELGMDTAEPENLNVNVLPISDLQCACTQVANTGSGAPAIFGNLLQANMCLLNCPTISLTTEVSANEGYILTNLLSGVNYTFEFCTGYDAATWEANISIANFDISNSTVGSAVHWETSSCTLTFMVPSDGDYIAIISETESCGGIYNETDNGEINFYCEGNSCPNICNSTFTDRRGPNLKYANDAPMGNPGDELYTICPDVPGQSIELTFTAFEIEPNGANNCWDYMEIYDGKDMTAPQIGGKFCGFTVADSPGAGNPIVSSHASGCLTVFFNPDNSVNLDGWEAMISCSGVVPIELLEFSAKAGKRAIHLEWKTATEVNNDGFEILRSANPTSGFEKLDWVDAKDNSNNQYQYLDSNARPNINYYYQLNQLDLDGKASRSQVVSAKWVGQRKNLVSYPNPTNQQLTIEKIETIDIEYQVMIYDLLGKAVLDRDWQKEVSKIALNVSDLAPGIYLLRVMDEQQIPVYTERIIKGK